MFAMLARVYHLLGNSQTLQQLAGVAVALALALLAGRAVHAVSRRRRPPSKPWLAALLEALVVLTPAISALPLLLLTHAIYAKFALPVAALDTAFDLTLAFLMVRVGVFLIGRLLGPLSWLHGWEAGLAWLVWLVIALQMVGWYTAIETALDAVSLVPGKGHFSLWSLLKSVFVITGFVLVSGLIARAVERHVMRLDGVAASTRLGISKFSHFFLISLGALLGVNAAGVDVTALTLLTGAIGIGLGFGLKEIASNFVSGFVLLLDKSIKPGDVISFTGLTGGSTENFGWVQELRGRCVVVRDRDGIDTLVPNENLMTSTVINWSYSDRKVRLKLPVRISYRDDPEIALQVLLGAVEDNRRVLTEPAPVTRLMQFAEDGMDLELRFWIADPQNGVNNVRSDVNRRIWRLFRDHGITIPVTQHEVRLVGDQPKS
jgi:small-conductance mechanosensitive channel